MKQSRKAFVVSKSYSVCKALPQSTQNSVNLHNNGIKLQSSCAHLAFLCVCLFFPLQKNVEIIDEFQNSTQRHATNFKISIYPILVSYCFAFESAIIIQ